MPREYVGHLPHHDPLFNYLSRHILPQIGIDTREVDFRVFHIQGSNVYIYEERYSRTKVVGKYFGVKGTREKTTATWRMLKEFENLQILRDYGFCGYPHHIVRPLGANVHISSVLIEEYCCGVSLSDIIHQAIYQNGADRLFSKLTSLAYFLATLHNVTANGCSANFIEDLAYMDGLVQTLRSKGFIAQGEKEELSWMRDRWREQPRMWEDREVLVHGDATPSNFLFGDGMNVTAIDLERMRRADRIFDIGRIAGELQHHYLQNKGDKYGAEPFIGHFLWEYACHFPDREQAFRSITRRLPFQMGLTLLRIARNSWVGESYRRQLIEEAKIILRKF